MYYAPHKLMKKVLLPPERDEFGRPIKGTGGDSWVFVCNCRCDDISAEKKVTVNGAVYDFKYKVVFPKDVDTISAGDEVRCLRADDSIRGEGIAKSPLETNLLNYRVIWLE